VVRNGAVSAWLVLGLFLAAGCRDSTPPEPRPLQVATGTPVAPDLARAAHCDVSGFIDLARVRHAQCWTQARTRFLSSQSGALDRLRAAALDIEGSLLETAKLHDVDPTHYLREAVRAADRGEALLPWQLAASPN